MPDWRRCIIPESPREMRAARFAYWPFAISACAAFLIDGSPLSLMLAVIAFHALGLFAEAA